MRGTFRNHHDTLIVPERLLCFAIRRLVEITRFFWIAVPTWINLDGSTIPKVESNRLPLKRHVLEQYTPIKHKNVFKHRANKSTPGIPTLIWPMENTLYLCLYLLVVSLFRVYRYTNGFHGFHLSASYVDCSTYPLVFICPFPE